MSRLDLVADYAYALSFGRTNGFTWHSLRHTFTTDMMEASGNNVALVMSYSGHKALESFKNLFTRPHKAV